MIPGYRGILGEYMFEKEMERLERYKDRPWELQSKAQTGGPLIAMVLVLLTVFVGLALLSLI